jgi:hypothetical protein
MDSAEIERELADAGELLTKSSMLRLAYNGLDGLPRVIPVSYYWTGTEIVLSTAAVSPKVAALSARPGVALSIDTGDQPETSKALSVRGIARLTIVDGVTDEYLAAARKNIDADKLADFERQVRAMYKQMARIAIEPHWARFYDFGAGRLPEFLTELIEHA